MDVAITGSTGFIGSALVTELEGAGHRAIRLVRPSSSSAGRDTIDWDPEVGTIDAEGLEGVQAIVHLAGEGIEARKWSDQQKARILHSRTRSTELLARTIDQLASPPKVWVSGSAIGYYGDRADEPIDETTPAGDDFLADVCVRWEAAARTETDTRVAHIRTGVVLAPHGGALAAQLPFFKLGLGGRLGEGSQVWSWISLGDAVSAITHIIDGDVAGPVNLTAPNPVTNAEFTKTLGHVLHRPTLVPTPRFAVDLRLGRELADALLFTSARVMPRVLQKSGFTFTDPHLRPALEAMLDRGKIESKKGQP